MSIIKFPVFAILLLISAYAADQGHDLAFRVHGFIVMLIVVFLLLRNLHAYGEQKPVASQDVYMDDVVRAGVIATAFWGVTGFLVGCFVAFQLAFPSLNFDWASGMANFGRLRPLHTSAVIFAFGGNALIATSFYVVQRTSRVRLFGGDLRWFVFWGYQLFIVLAATGWGQSIVGLTTR